MESTMVLCAVAMLSCITLINGQSFDRLGECPYFPDDFGGQCTFNPNVHCREDSQCGNGEKCCSNGCNRICKVAVAENRYDECPLPSSSTGTCEFVPGVNCLDDLECGPYQKCCSEGCGKVCKNVNLGSKLAVSISFLLLTSVVAAILY